MKQSVSVQYRQYRPLSARGSIYAITRSRLIDRFFHGGAVEKPAKPRHFFATRRRKCIYGGKVHRREKGELTIRWWTPPRTSFASFSAWSLVSYVRAPSSALSRTLHCDSSRDCLVIRENQCTIAECPHRGNFTETTESRLTSRFRRAKRYREFTSRLRRKLMKIIDGSIEKYPG